MPEAARLGDTITHTKKLGGFLTGALLGAAVGAFVVATGGAGAVLIAGAALSGLAVGSQIGAVVGGKKKVPKGNIITGAGRVFINGRPAARACIDTALCDDHSVKKIAVGSVTVGIEGGAAARIGDKGECGFEIGEGSATVIIGGAQGMCPGLSVADEVPPWMRHAASAAGIVGAVLTLGGGAAAMSAEGVAGSVIATRLGAMLVGGTLGGTAGHYAGGKIFGEGSLGQLLMEMGGAAVGARAGGRLATLAEGVEVRTVGPGSQSVDEWARDFPRKPTPNNTIRDAYEIKHTGPENIQVEGGGARVWADGMRSEDARLLEAKHVTNPDRSPFVSDSKMPDFVREKIVTDVNDEFRRYGAVINDPNTPVKGLEVITNDPKAVPFFEGLMQKHNIPGQVVVKP